MLEHSQSRQSQTSDEPNQALNNPKIWFIPENCVGLNVNEKYDVMNKLQEDSLSVTYLVKQYLHNPTLGRFFQLKLYKPSILHEEWLKEGVLEQIKNNLSLNSRLILSCYEYGEWNNIPFTIHDFFEWKTLENIISERENKPISSKFAVSCAIEVLKSLESLYSYPCEFKYSTHFIHGNLTPSKVIISQDTGMVLLADTGIIALYSRACLNDSSLLPLEITYLSPEQINFEPISIASDIFTVGLLLLDLLSPVYREKMNSFSREQTYEFLNEKLFEELAAFNLNDELIKILKKALEPNENARYQTPALFIADLNAYLRKQYWVFDIQENIKTVFYQQEDSNKPNAPRLNLNKTLQLSTPKELVNSVPLDELTEEIDKITAPKIIESKMTPPKITSVSITKEEKIIETTNKTAPLHRFEPLPLPIIKAKESKPLNKKLIGIIVAAAVVLFVIISSIKGHHSKQQETIATAQQPTPVIVNNLSPVVIKKPIPVVVHKPAHKITAPPVAQVAKPLPKPVVVAKTHPKTLPTPIVVPVPVPAQPTPAPVLAAAPQHTANTIANVSINAVPFATIDIPAANIADQITPLANIKIPVAKSIAIIVRHGTCSFRKIVDSQEKSSFNLRFNMYACKEY